jgi:hypothetical protein
MLERVPPDLFVHERCEDVLADQLQALQTGHGVPVEDDAAAVWFEQHGDSFDDVAGTAAEIEGLLS